MLTIMAFSKEWALWWIPGIPWIIVSILGILLTLPLAFVISIGAGCAQADWMSDAFIITLCFVIPTTLAVGANYCIAWLRGRGKDGNKGRGEQ
jgi:hypothetical protein